MAALPLISRRTLLEAGATLSAVAVLRADAAGARPAPARTSRGTPRILQPTNVDHFDPLTSVGGRYPSALIQAQIYKWARPPAGRPGVLLADEPYRPYMGYGRSKMEGELAVKRAAEAGLAYLGIGVDGASWGQTILKATNYFQTYPLYLWQPLIGVVLLVLALNLLGDAIRDALDPKTRR